MGCCRENGEQLDVLISDPGIQSANPFNVHEDHDSFVRPVPIHVKKVHPNARLPQKSYDGDIAWDICCVQDDKWSGCILDERSEPCFELMPGQSHTFRTGIKVAAPKNYGFLLRERSGLAVKNNISLAAGVIEGTYRDEWRVHLRNLSHEPKVFYIGDKICQAVLTYIIPAVISEVKSLPETERGEKGFGSSGR